MTLTYPNVLTGENPKLATLYEVVELFSHSKILPCEPRSKFQFPPNFLGPLEADYKYIKKSYEYGRSCIYFPRLTMSTLKYLITKEMI